MLFQTIWREFREIYQNYNNMLDIRNISSSSENPIFIAAINNAYIALEKFINKDFETLLDLPNTYAIHVNRYIKNINLPEKLPETTKEEKLQEALKAN